MAAYPLERINPKFDALNVIEFPVNHDLVARSYAEVADLLEPGSFDGHRVSGLTGIGLYSTCPGWNGDLRWISPGNLVGFEFFEHYFCALRIEEKTKAVVGDCGPLIMYSGFFVVRSHTTDPTFHYDYSDQVGMNALTLMTPVMTPAETGHLLYETRDGAQRVYSYSPGNAVAFGSEFYHSTEPFTSDEPYIFLCFTYGVDDTALWDKIAETVTEQGCLYRHPLLGVVETS